MKAFYLFDTGNLPVSVMPSGSAPAPLQDNPLKKDPDRHVTEGFWCKDEKVFLDILCIPSPAGLCVPAEIR